MDIDCGRLQSADLSAATTGQLRRRILVPLAAVLLILLAAFSASLYRSNQIHLTESFGVELRTTQFHYQSLLRLRGEKLAAALRLLSENRELADALASGDRNRLRTKFAVSFETLKQNSGVTHFYFLDAEQTVLLRMHEPDRFGDRVGPGIAREALREGRIATGAEVDKMGAFVVRAVSPVRIGQRVVGYVELGEEINDTLQELAQAFGFQAYLLLYKTQISRPQWEAGMRQLGREPEWERFPAHVLVAQTQSMPAALARLIEVDGQAHMFAHIELHDGDRDFRTGLIPLLDADHRDVGDLVILRDTTAVVANTRHETYWICAVTAGAGMLLLVLFHFVLGRAESALAASNRQAFNEAQARAALQKQHIEELSERKRAEEELRIAAIAFEAQEAMMVTDANSIILRVNHAFTRYTGYEAGDVIGRNPSMLKSGRHDAGFYRAMWTALSRDGYWEGEIWNKRKNGEVYPEWQTISSVPGADGRVSHYVAAFSDLSGRKEAERRIYHLAFFDNLTELPNRRLLLDRIGHALATSNRSGRYGALLFIDLDNFKSLNDTQGHDIGDQLLVAVAKRLQDSLRGEDTIARLGGDEFMVVLEGLCEDAEVAAGQAEGVAGKIIDALNQPYHLNGQSYFSTPSIGVTIFCGFEHTVEELMKRADVAMYQAKDAGRNTVRFFAPAIQMALEARLALEAELRRAIPQREFRLHYQLQVDRDGRIFGAEALIRWQHPQRGQVSPAQFVPLAEETGLIVPIGQWVLESACAQIKAWQAQPATRRLRLAINVSARQFRQPDFVRQVRAALDTHRVDPAHLKLELTESVVVDNIEDTIQKMRALQGLGVGFSVDDFGTGYSSLAYLKRLPIEQLKIDRSFVRDLATDPNDAAIVQAIIGLARSLGLIVVAEGVETKEQWDFLHVHGCPAFQGYLISKPLPLAEFELLLETRGDPALDDMTFVPA